MTMKKILIFVVLSGCTLFGFAQVQDTTTIHRKNVIKFLPMNLPFQSISFEFERMINSRNSVTIGIGLPNQKSLIGKYGIEASSDLETLELGTMHIRAAFRHYTGKRMLPKGFYIEPYMKYQNIKIGVSYTDTDNQNQSYVNTVDAKLHTMNMGFQIGTQFLIAKRIAVDFYILGLEAGLLSGEVDGRSTLITGANELKTKFDDAIADMPSFIGKKITVTQSGNQVTAKASSIPYPWMRGGISIGIAF